MLQRIKYTIINTQIITENYKNKQNKIIQHSKANKKYLDFFLKSNRISSGFITPQSIKGRRNSNSLSIPAIGARYKHFFTIYIFSKLISLLTPKFTFVLGTKKKLKRYKPILAIFKLPYHTAIGFTRRAESAASPFLVNIKILRLLGTYTNYSSYLLFSSDLAATANSIYFRIYTRLLRTNFKFLNKIRLNTGTESVIVFSHINYTTSNSYCNNNNTAVANQSALSTRNPY
jgi:hypothetical protein